MTIALSPASGLRDTSTYPSKPGTGSAAREQVQSVIDQVITQANTELSGKSDFKASNSTLSGQTSYSVNAPISRQSGILTVKLSNPDWGHTYIGTFIYNDYGGFTANKVTEIINGSFFSGVTMTSVAGQHKINFTAQVNWTVNIAITDTAI